MPRNIDPLILAELNKDTISSGFFYLFELQLRSGTYRWDKRGQTADGHVYEPRILNCSDLSQAASDSGELTLTVNNSDGLITTISQTESTYGCMLTIRRYTPAVNLTDVVWVGYLEELSEVGPAEATFTAYADQPGMDVHIPRRQITLTCPHSFGTTITNANWAGLTRFDGAECTYQKDATRGFVGALVGAQTSGATSFDVLLGATPSGAGMRYKVSDEIRIGSETMLVTAVTALSGAYKQTLTVTRGWRSTTPASHGDNETVYFASCQKSTSACVCRGMYGNNASDTYSSPARSRNYFGGFPIFSGTEYGKFLTAAGDKAKWQRVYFGSNESAYERTLPRVYGRVRLSNPILLMAEAQGDYLTTLWAVAEGTLATNATDNSQTTPLNAYFPDPNPPKGYSNLASNSYAERYLRVNGALRHDPRAGFGIQTSNGAQDTVQPDTAVFFPNVADFATSKLAMWGTAWVIVRIQTTNNPSIDASGGSIQGAMGIAYGDLVHVYTSATGPVFTEKATTNPAWVLMDVMANKRAGAGVPYSLFNIQSWIDLAANNDALVTSTVDPTASVKRWTFNGIVEGEKSYDEQVSLIAMGMSATRPYLDASGTYAIKPIRKLTAGELTAVDASAFFSDKDGVSRNILWENGQTTLRKFKRRRRDEIPNRMSATYVSVAAAQGYQVNHGGGYASGFGSIAIDGGSGAFVPGQLIRFLKPDGTLVQSGSGANQAAATFQITSSTGGSSATSIDFTPTLPTGGVPDNAIIIHATDHSKVTFMLDDEPSQTLANGTRHIVPHSIDLMGASTLDEAARRATLALRIGEFGEGGLSNNEGIRFQTFVKTSANCERGDVIAVESSTLDPVLERYWRITNINDKSITLDSGALIFQREIEAMLHDQSFFDDTAYTVTNIISVEPGGANDIAPPAVTGFSVTESRIVDANGTPTTQLVINYTEPDPPENYKSVAIMRSHDTAGAQVGDWSFIGEITSGSGQALAHRVSGAYEWFAAVSRTKSGHTALPDTLAIDGSYKYPRVRILVDGKADTTLAAPTGLAAYGRLNRIALEWNAYTGTSAQLFKRYNVYRGTLGDGSDRVQIAEADSNRYTDSSPTVVDNPTIDYYYWVKGVSKFENVVINGVTQDGLSPFSSSAHDNAGTDAALPSAPTVGVIRNMASYSQSEIWLTIGVTKPGGATNWDTVENFDVQMSTDNTFATFPDANCIPPGPSPSPDYRRVHGQPPDIIEHKINRPGVYYIRARVVNQFGAGAWSSTLTHNTDSTLNLTTDTDVPPQVSNLTLGVSTASDPIGGNAYRTKWQLPGTTNMGSYWGYGVILHDANTLPTTTKAYDSAASSTTGSISPNSNRLTVSPSAGWSANQWTTPNEHDVLVFSPKRGASPQWELEGLWYLAKITGNGADTIDFDFAPERQTRNNTGLKFWIVRRNNASHLHEQVHGMAQYSQIDPGVYGLAAPTDLTRRVDTTLKLTSAYAYVFSINLWGFGKLTGPTASASMLGMINAEVFGTTAGAGAITKEKTAIVNLGDITLSLGTVETGLMRTAPSGNRVEIDGTNGLRMLNAGGSVLAQMPVDGSALRAVNLYPVGTSSSSTVHVWNGDQSNEFRVGTDIRALVGGTATLVVTSTAVSITGDLNINGSTVITSGGIHTGNGSSLTSLNASNLASGTVNNARLPSAISVSSLAATGDVAGATVTRNGVEIDSRYAQKSGVGSHSIPLAKITGGGADGSITFNADGIVTGYVDPT